MAVEKIVIDMEKADATCNNEDFGDGIVGQIAIPANNIKYLCMLKNGTLRITLKDNDGSFYVANKKEAQSIYRDYISGLMKL